MSRATWTIPRRITLRGGWFAGRQTDLTLRHGEARERIKHQQNVFAPGGKIFRNRGRRQGSADRTEATGRVETTTTDRRRPSSPSALRKSPTSRPRSPTRASTVDRQLWRESSCRPGSSCRRRCRQIFRRAGPDRSDKTVDGSNAASQRTLMGTRVKGSGTVPSIGDSSRSAILTQRIQRIAPSVNHASQ